MTGVAAVTAAAWLIGAAFFTHVAMTIVVGDWCGRLTFMRRRRLIALKRNEGIDSFLTAWLVVWLRSVDPILGTQGRPVAGSWWWGVVVDVIEYRVCMCCCP